jgi:hypothetical protein
VLRKRDWLMIQERIEQGVYVKDIAAELGVHPAHGKPGVKGRGIAAGAAAGGAQEQA